MFSGCGFVMPLTD